MSAAPSRPTAVASPSEPLWRRRHPLVLGLCGVLLAALLAVALLAPLPFAVTHPGLTANVLGERDGQPVISISGAEVRQTEGELLLTTIQATSPDATVRFTDVISGYFAEDRAVMPREAVYPGGGSTQEIRRHNTAEMQQSQQAAVAAALRHLGLEDSGITVELHLADVGGPSAGLLFSLGIVDLLAGDGAGGDLTGGRVIAGTGTIEPDGTVGAVGGVPLKTQAAARDRASVFLLPRDECGDALADLPEGLRLVPVSSLDEAVTALRHLSGGGPVPAC